MSAYTVQIKHLPAMRLAALTVNSPSPEMDAINGIWQWATAQHIDLSAQQLFGYDTCQPAPDHAYTALLTIDADMEPQPPLRVHHIAAGRYATTSVTSPDDIKAAWTALQQWVRASTEDFGDGLGLEAIMTADDDPQSIVRFDIYMPLADAR